MRLVEHQAKSLIAEWGVTVPRGTVAQEACQAAKITAKFGGPVMIKAQVPIGGRGKAGAVISCTTPKEAEEAAARLLGSTVRGYEVTAVLVEDQLSVVAEFYMAVTLDLRQRRPVFVFSPRGGIEVEDSAGERADLLTKVAFDPSDPPPEYILRSALVETSGGTLRGKKLIGLSNLGHTLCSRFLTHDLTLCELNPLGCCPAGQLVALDAKLEVDDAALFRQDRLASLQHQRVDPFERQASEIGVTYHRLEGNIGIVASGAGLGMSTMDLIAKKGYSAANFLETGGKITQELMCGSVLLVASDPQVEGIIVNLYGGVNPLVEAVKGVVAAVQQLTRTMPVVVKALGNRQRAAWEVLNDYGLVCIRSVVTEEAVEALITQMEQRT